MISPRSSFLPRLTSCHASASRRLVLGNRTLGSLLCLAVAAGLTACAGEPPPSAFKISVAADGVYAVAFDSLQSAGLEQAKASGDLRLTVDGEPVPIWVEDGGDSEFGPGDHFEFIGKHAAGDRSYFSEHDILNHYRLSVTGAAQGEPAELALGPALRYSAANVAPIVRDDSAQQVISVERHFEEDKLLVRFAARPNGENPEPWYWARLTQVDKQPWVTSFPLQELDRRAGPVSLKVALRGWSQHRRRGVASLEQTDHRIEVHIGGALVGVGEWNGQEQHFIEIDDLRDHVASGDNTVKVSVPRRMVEGSEDQLVDVVLLNWVEVSYQRGIAFGAQGFSGEHTAPLVLARSSDAAQGVAIAGSQRLDVTTLQEQGKTFRWKLATGGDLTYAPVLFEPEGITVDRPSDLKAKDQQADYLMITTGHLQAEVEPLAKFHASRGLTTKVVDIADVFDEFRDGQTHPDALRDFVSYAYHEWSKPAPRFVLLVGDASWDVRNLEGEDQRYADWTYRTNEVRRFMKNQSTSYSEELLAHHRNLIPTSRYHTSEGQAASDNYFVAVDGDDYLPDLAIGRFPVTEPEEVRAIVQKTIRYIDHPEVGPWRRSVLWVTNESRGYQRNNERLAQQLGERGYGALRVYPQSEEKDNSQHQQKLIEAFDQGVSVVNFIGHGGRYIWRTGPPDPAKNHDLFTLDHLDQLKPNERLPVVVSLTCYSAPFDHPTADSIGEKFLRMADRGAVGVFAASWRNSPSAHFSGSLMTSLVDPAFESIGEALTYGKSQVRNPLIVNTYNYFGDPAAPMARPVGEVDLEYAPGSNQLLVQLRGAATKVVLADGNAGADSNPQAVAEPTEGPLVDLNARAIVEWIGQDGLVLGEAEIKIADGVGKIQCDGDCGDAASVRAYAWSKRKGWDAVGSLALPPRAAAAGGL